MYEAEAEARHVMSCSLTCLASASEARHAREQLSVYEQSYQSYFLIYPERASCVCIECPYGY